MKIYEKIRRRLQNTTYLCCKKIFKDKTSKIVKDISLLQSTGFNIDISPLTIPLFQSFCEEIYIPIIGTKFNANTKALISSINENNLRSKERFFLGIRKNNNLLGGAIFTYQDGIFQLSYKANVSDKLGTHSGLGAIIDYLFFAEGFKKSPLEFSYGIDRNFYGKLGTSSSLAMHKLRLSFLPKVIENPSFIDISVCTNSDYLIFSDTNNNDFFTVAYISNPNGTIDEGLLKKRGFLIKYL